MCVRAATRHVCICNDLHVCLCVCVVSFTVTYRSRHLCYVILAVKRIHTHLRLCAHTDTYYIHTDTPASAFKQLRGYSRVVVRKPCVLSQHNQDRSVPPSCRR